MRPLHPLQILPNPPVMHIQRRIALTQAIMIAVVQEKQRRRPKDERSIMHAFTVAGAI